MAMQPAKAGVLKPFFCVVDPFDSPLKPTGPLRKMYLSASN